ncbi:MAG: glycosyltransferase [Verrucomicrobiota bacterium]
MSNILILSNDAFRVKAKTCEALASACRRLGHFALVRDTADARFGLQANGKENADFRANLASKYLRILDFFEIDMILALDLDWLLLPDEFLNHPNIKKIVSLWFDDLQTWLQGPVHEFFPSPQKNLIEILKHEKILHCFYGQGQAWEAELLGINNQRLSPLAAAQELLSLEKQPEIAGRFAFVGNPGCRQTPHPGIVQRMHEGADLSELRQLAREHILRFPPDEMKKWIEEEPSCREFFEFALQVRVMDSFKPACEILKTTAVGYPQAYAYLQNKEQLLIACLIIKLVNQYDRPALIHRLYKKNLVDVFSAPEEWKTYGVESKPFVNALRLPELYQRYPMHLNAPNPLRDATANEKLFELSACARASINLDTPDARACYGENEMRYARTLEELENVAEDMLRRPDEMFALGKNARQRTALEHTWDHRLQKIL